MDVKIKQWASSLGYTVDLETCKKLCTVELNEFWKRTVTSRPKYEWREYKNQTNHQSELLLKRHELEGKVRDLKSRLLDRMDRPLALDNVENQIENINTRIIFKEKMMEFIREQIVCLSESKIGQIGRSSELEQYQEIGAVTIESVSETENEFIKKALKSHVLMSGANRKQELVVDELRTKAKTLLSTLDPKEQERLRKSACLKLIEFIQSQHDQTLGNDQSIMELELFFSENNAKMIQGQQDLKYLMEKFNTICGSMKESIKDSKRTSKFITQLHSEVPQLFKELELVLGQISVLIPTLDIMRMASQESLFDWKWQHDNVLAQMKLELDLPSSFTFEAFNKYVKEQKSRQLGLQEMKRLAEDRIAKLQRLETKVCKEEDIVKGIYGSLEKVAELIDEYESVVIPGLKAVIEHENDCFRVQNQVQKLVDEKEWYFSHRDEILDTLEKLDS